MDSELQLAQTPSKKQIRHTSQLANGETIVNGELIVVAHFGVSQAYMERIADKYNMAFNRNLNIMNGYHLISKDDPASKDVTAMKAIKQSLKKEAGIKYVEFNKLGSFN